MNSQEHALAGIRQEYAGHPSPAPDSETFASRIKVLIQRVGSVTAIARTCGFSEGVVRSWWDGNTDPSRARCVTLARTLGISLVWLVAGEGTLQIDPTAANTDDQYSSDTTTSRRSRGRLALHAPTNGARMDPQRLDAAMRILQSELEMADSQLSLAENGDLLTQLYEIVGPGGSHVNPLAMVMFNHQLRERIRKDHASV